VKPPIKMKSIEIRDNDGKLILSIERTKDGIFTSKRSDVSGKLTCVLENNERIIIDLNK